MWASAAIFHNKSRQELNVPGLGPEANFAPHFSADLSLGLNLKSVIATPIEHWESAIPITAGLISLPAIFFPPDQLEVVRANSFPPLAVAVGGCWVASLRFCWV